MSGPFPHKPRQVSKQLHLQLKKLLTWLFFIVLQLYNVVHKQVMEMRIRFWRLSHYVQTKGTKCQSKCPGDLLSSFDPFPLLSCSVLAVMLLCDSMSWKREIALSFFFLSFFKGRWVWSKFHIQSCSPVTFLSGLFQTQVEPLVGVRSEPADDWALLCHPLANWVKNEII